MARAIGARGREWAEQFTWDALAQRQLEFYEELVEKGR
jgi:glycosyltransferase involved in cell wall biosynthesis